MKAQHFLIFSLITAMLMGASFFAGVQWSSQQEEAFDPDTAQVETPEELVSFDPPVSESDIAECAEVCRESCEEFTDEDALVSCLEDCSLFCQERF